MLTHEYLLSRLSYDPETGVFLWLAYASRPKQWHTRYAGKPAGSKNFDGHVVINLDGVSHYAHRLAWFYVTGEWPTTTVDHEDRDRSNNRWGNLREATPRQQRQNTEARVGVKGVRRVWNKWAAQIKHKGRSRYLGLFSTIEEASAAYDAAARELHGEFFYQKGTRHASG